jgi:hypothetical protein
VYQKAQSLTRSDSICELARRLRPEIPGISMKTEQDPQIDSRRDLLKVRIKSQDGHHGCQPRCRHVVHVAANNDSAFLGFSSFNGGSWLFSALMLAAKTAVSWNTTVLRIRRTKNKIHPSKFTSDTALIKLRRQRAGNEEFFSGFSLKKCTPLRCYELEIHCAT